MTNSRDMPAEVATSATPTGDAVPTVTDPQPAGPAGGRLVSWLAFVFGSVMSVAANVLHAWIPPPGAPDGWAPELAPQIGAAVWPIGLLLSVEVLSRVRWAPGWQWRLARYGGVGTVGLGSAVISYGHLHGVLLAWHYTPLGASVGPLVLDGLMVISGFALLSMSHTTPAKPTHTGASGHAGSPSVVSEPSATDPLSDPPGVHPPGARSDAEAGVRTQPVSGALSVQPAPTRPAVVSDPVSEPAHAAVSDRSAVSGSGVSDPGVSDRSMSGGPADEAAMSARDRAVIEALRHHVEFGALPSVRQLSEAAGVGRGTAADALKDLRTRPTPLHLITSHDADTPERHTQP